MTRLPVFSPFRFVLVVLVAAATGACQKASAPGESDADDYFYDCASTNQPPGLTVFATDESYRTFVDAITATGLIRDDNQAPRLLAPAAETALSIAAPPAFSFSELLARQGGDRPSPARAGGRSRWARFMNALSWEGTAWAHCPNVTGSLYMLQLSAPGQAVPVYTALVSVTSFTPTAGIWQEKLQPWSGKRLSVTLAGAVFSMGQVRRGPFVVTKETSFTVGP